MTGPLLSVTGVKTFYGNVMALRGVDLAVHRGEIVALIGANGAGKSTLMMTILGSTRAREARYSSTGGTLPICRPSKSPGCPWRSPPKGVVCSPG